MAAMISGQPRIQLHPGQAKVYRDPHRFKVVVAGRRWGKTQLAKSSIIRRAIKPNQRIWYVAPSYRMAKMIMWDDLKSSIPKQWLAKPPHETELTITLKNGTTIECKGADQPDRLRGAGLHFLVLDEFQDFKPDTWIKVLRPTLASTMGDALFIGCVRGDTRVLPKRGARTIQSYAPKNCQPKTLTPIDEPLYGIDREFHSADGFWDNGIVDTKKIKTRCGFEIEGSHRHPLLVMDSSGLTKWKRSDEIMPGDRVAIARNMEVWGDQDPCAGFNKHIENWRAERNGTETKAV